MTQTIRIEQYEVAPQTDGRNVSIGRIDWQKMWDVKVAFDNMDDAGKFAEYASKYFAAGFVTETPNAKKIKMLESQLEKLRTLKDGDISDLKAELASALKERITDNRLLGRIND